MCCFPFFVVVVVVTFRSSRPEVFLRKGVLKICKKFTGEHPCRSVISIKLLCNFIEITFWHGCSPVNLLYIFRTPFLKNTFGRLVLKRVALGTYSCFLVIPLISDIFVWKFRTIPNTFLLQHFCFTWDLDISPRMISENTGFC